MDAKEEAYRNIHQDLLDRCMNGDQQAQFQIYKLYYRSMYNTSLRIVNDTMEAEDVMQESFLSAFDKIGTYRHEVSFGAWLKRIVINKSLDHLKKRKMILEPVDDFHHLSDGDGATAEKAFPEEEMRNKLSQVRDALDNLPEGYRLVLSLYLLEGYDHDEIGEILGISGSTSRSQYARAKKKLLELINRD